MNREQLTEYITEQYAVDAESPWVKQPRYIVFRRRNNQKWFALLMDIPKNKLGLAGTDVIDVVNVKCDPILIGSLRGDKGIYPAYHMSKDTWITIALDGGLADDKLKWLIDLSYELTDAKKKPKGSAGR